MATTANPGTGLGGIPTNVLGLAVVSNHKAEPISAAVFNEAQAALLADKTYGHRQAYLILYEATGNPAFSSNLAIATTSGQIGGVAWNANQQVLEKYPDKYPKVDGQLSIAKFSWLVGENNIKLIAANRNPDGSYTVPDEHTLHKDADHLTWIQQGLAEVSPPGFLVTMDQASDYTLLAPVSAALSGLAHPETYAYINKAVGMTNTQTAVAGANDNGNTGRVWVGKNFDEVVNAARSQGGYTIKQVRDLTVVTDVNGVVQGAWTQQAIMEATTQRVYQIMRGTTMSFAEAREVYFAQTGHARADANARLQAGGMTSVTPPSGNAAMDFPDIAGAGRGVVNPPLIEASAGRDSASYIAPLDAHSVQVKTGGKTWDVYVSQRDQADGFKDWNEFQHAAAVSNPHISNLAILPINSAFYIPQKHSDGNITYHYAGGAEIKTNPGTGEYHMTVPNADGNGGQTTYSRTSEGNALGGEGYIIKQNSTNAAGATTFDFTGRQATLDSEITPVFKTEQVDGQQTSSFYDTDGVLTGRSTTLSEAGGAPSSDSLADMLQSLRDATGDLDGLVLDAAELRALSGSQAEGEAWGGARLLTLGDSALGDYYRHHQEAQTGSVIPLLLDDPQTQGLGLLDGFDLGNGASVLDYSYEFESWNYLNNSAGGIDYIDWGYDTSAVGYASYNSSNYDAYTYDSYDYSAYSYNSYTYDSYDYGASNYGSYDYGWSNWWPVALDMDADGVELVTQEDSHAWYDVQGDGYRRNIGWVGSDDALLAIDENHDGKITDARELSFAMWTADAGDTDLQALKTAFDTNHDQKLDAQDARFTDLRTWQDKNGDGVSDAGELKTLAEAGIKSIGLTVAQTDWSSGGNRVTGFATYEKTNGTRGWAADVGLGYDTQGWKASVESNLVRMTESGGLVYGIARSSALNLDLGAQGLDGAIGSAGSDTLAAGNKKAVLLEGGAGDDKLTGGAGDDWLAGDAGSDTLSGGDGDDTLVIDAQDAQANLNGGAGFDMAVVTGSAAVSLDLGATGIEAAVGGAGNDNLRTSGTGRVILAGGAGSDSLTGSVAGDLLYGGTGDDALKGGRGNDVYVFNRGDGVDTITDAATGMTTVTNTTTSVEYFPTVVLEPWVLAIDYPFQAMLDQAISSLNAAGVAYGSAAYSYAMNFSFKNGWRYATGSRTTSTTTTTPVEVEVDAGQDTLRFGADIGREDLDAEISGSSLVIGVRGGTDSMAAVTALSDRLTITNWQDTNQRIESFRFANGTVEEVGSWRVGTADRDYLFGDGNANRLFGGGGMDILDGGAGADNMQGGLGNDSYVVDNVGDVVTETSTLASGIDEVQSSISYTLSANVEKLGLTGTSAINGTGNALNNILIGNSGNNVLDGGAGNDFLNGSVGTDVLNGGDGDDRYSFGPGCGQDTIVDSSGNDRIEFYGITAQQITASMANGQVTLAIAPGDSVSFAATGINNYAIEQLQFAGNSVLGAAWLNGLLNVAPTGANKTLTFNEDSPYTITAVDLGFADGNAGDTLSAVRIDSLPVTGSLKLNGAAVTAAQVVTAADLSAGRLVFSPAANVNGSNYANFTFSVKDQYGAFDAAPNTLSFNVTPVNDAPILTGTKATRSAGTEDAAYTITQASLLAGFSDVEGNPLSVVNLGTNNGTLLAFNAATNSWTFTPAANFNGTVNLSYGVSDGAVITPATQSFTMAAINDAPTLTAFAAAVTTANEDSEVQITFAQLLAQGNEADVDGTVSAFLVKAVSSGSLRIGATAAMATAWNAATNNMVDGTRNAYWTPASNANGALNAFMAVAKDNSGMESTTAIQAKVAVSPVNDLPTGAITASGTPTQNQVLTVTNTLTDIDGLGVVSYQWLAGGATITGATNSSLTLSQALVGKAISVKASYTDPQGTSESVTSATTAAVTNVNDAPTGGVTLLRNGLSISSATTVLQGDALSASNTLADADGLGALSYQWQSSTNGSIWSAISGATAASFTLTPALAGQSARVTASYIDGFGAVESMASVATAAVNWIIGTAGADKLAGTAGADRLEGLAGSDSYTVNNAGDVVIENANEGIDTVSSSVDYALTANVENLTLLGTAAIGGTGNSLGNTITGNSSSNVLTGGEGDDVLDRPAAGVSTIVYVTGAAVARYVVDGGPAISLSFADGVVPSVVTGQQLKISAGLNTVKVYVTPGSRVDASTLAAAGDRIYLSGKFADYSQTIDQEAGVYTFTRIAGLPAGQNESALVALSDSDVRLHFADGYIGLNAFADARLIDFDTYVFHTIQQGWLMGGAQTWPTNVPILSQGADRLVGGLGSDSYFVDDAGDVVLENLSEGSDTVTSFLDYTLTANVENLTLAGAAAIGTGNSLVNTITGNSGNNVLIGGFGADTLIGGDGDDVLDGLAPALGVSTTVYVTGASAAKYVVDGGTATAFSFADGIVPGVSAGQSLKVSNGVNPVKVYVTRGSRVDASNLIAAGDSIYLSGKLADYSQAIDQDLGIYTFTRLAGLPAGQSESAMVTVSDADTRLYFADGVIGLNALADARLLDFDTFVFHAIQQSWLTGGAQAWPASVPLMSQGADQLVGGLGSDSYFVDDAGDVVVENAGEGIDTVNASVSYTLAAHVENLTLGGIAAINGAGNALNNTIIGNNAANVLDGGAGAGADILSGGKGNDTYTFGRGYGADIVQENDATADNNDVLQFLSGVRADQIWMRHLGNDLKMSVIGTGDEVAVQNWYAGSQYHVEQIRSGDGKLLQHTNVEKLVSAMAGFAPPVMGETSLPATYAAQLAPVLAANWQ